MRTKTAVASKAAIMALRMGSNAFLIVCVVPICSARLSTLSSSS